MSHRENVEHCRKISQEMEKCAEGLMYRCEECREVFEIREDDEKCACPECGESLGECEPLTLYDYFDDALDIEYRIGADQKYRSVEVTVAWGGPNIFVDTASRNVKLYWGTDYAEWPLSNHVCVETDNIFEELYNCR